MTSIIFTASAQHAAVNFPQSELMSYVPNFPAAMYQPEPTDANPASEEDYLDYLPPIEMARLQYKNG